VSGIGSQQLGDVKAAAFRDVVTRGDWHERFQLVVREDPPRLALAERERLPVVIEPASLRAMKAPTGLANDDGRAAVDLLPVMHGNAPLWG
jgi:hypothetical protein